MNEFEWLRQTRALARPSTPLHDPWPGIARAISAASPHAMHPAWSIAAAIALACAGLLGFYAGLQTQTAPASTARHWHPDDPRLAAAAVGLDAAHAELSQALQLDPRADYLHKLLQRTERKREYLQNLEHHAG